MCGFRIFQNQNDGPVLHSQPVPHARCRATLSQYLFSPDFLRFLEICKSIGIRRKVHFFHDQDPCSGKAMWITICFWNATLDPPMYLTLI
jgi:hypothetical protein